MEISGAFVRNRRRYPRQRLFVVLDNVNHVYDHPPFLALPRRLRIHPIAIESLTAFTLLH